MTSAAKVMKLWTCSQGADLSLQPWCYYCGKNFSQCCFDNYLDWSTEMVFSGGTGRRRRGWSNNDKSAVVNATLMNSVKRRKATRFRRSVVDDLYPACRVPKRIRCYPAVLVVQLSEQDSACIVYFRRQPSDRRRLMKAPTLSFVS